MIIKSQFKDYYDYVAHLYGGGDPKVVYPRRPLTHLLDESNKIKVMTSTENFENLPHRYYYHYDRISPNVHFKWLVVTSKYYLLCGMSDVEGGFIRWKVFNKQDHPKDWAYLIENKSSWMRQRREFYFGYETPALLEVSRALKEPVFCITGIERKHKQNGCIVTVEEIIPNLGLLGMPSLISPEQMYQDIAYFVGNKIHVSPDLAPPVKVSDKDRIMQYGFDLKTSFRHPVK